MTGPEPDRRRPVQAGDLQRLRWPLHPRVRPDGGAVAFVVCGLDPVADALSYELRVRDLGSSDELRLDRASRVRSPTWSPDGSRLAYAAAGSDRHAVLVVSPGASSAQVVWSGECVDLDWSPDGSRLALVGADGSLTIVDPARPESGTSCPAPPGSRLARWSPDGTRVTVAGGQIGLTPLRSSVVDIDPGTGRARPLLTWDGPVRAIAWSPDGDVLAVLGHDRGPGGWELDGVWLLSDSGQIEIDVSGDASGDRAFGGVVRGDDERGLGTPDLHWFADGTGLVTLRTRGGRSGVVHVGLDGTVVEHVGGDRAVLEFSVSADGSATVFSWSDPCNPGELSMFDGEHEHRVTALNDEWLAEVELAPTIGVSAADPSDPTAPPVEGWLTIPEGDDRAGSDGHEPFPLLVQVHGGPHYPVGERFSFDSQRLASLGIAVLRGNPRGSGGYGREFARSVRADWGGPDLRDVLALVERSTARPDIDGTRVAIAGESYGGFLAYWATGSTRQFVAGIVENAVADPLPLAHGPDGPGFWWIEFGASPTEDEARFTTRSALTRTASMSTPLMIIHARDDERCPIAQSESMVRALRDAGHSPRFVPIDDEGHMMNIFGHLSHRLERAAAYDSFLCEHLVGDRRPGSAGGEH